MEKLRRVLVFALLVATAANAQFNPSILQDTRNEPKVDGTFGFLYRTEDGIAHAAKGDATGAIHGRFSYSDPSGFKLNYNYNAGTQTVPGYNYDDKGQQITQANPRPYDEAPQSRYNQPAPPPQEYAEREPAFRPQSRYRPQPEEYRPPFRPQYRQPEPVYERRTRPYAPRRNEVYDDY